MLYDLIKIVRDIYFDNRTSVTIPGELGSHSSNYISELGPTAKAVKRARIKNNHRRREEIFDSITAQVKNLIDNIGLIILCGAAIVWACCEFGHQLVCDRLAFMVIGAVIGPIITSRFRKNI